MKKIYSLLLILVLPLLSACEGYLDKPDSDDVTVDKAFETVKSARKVLNNLYYEVRTAAYNVNTRKIPYAQACDDGLPGSGLWGDKFHSGSWTPDDDPNMGDDNQGVASGIILIRESEKQTCSWKTSIEQRVMSLRKLACMQKPVSCVLSITLNWSDVLVELLYWIIPLMLMITQH